MDNSAEGSWLPSHRLLQSRAAHTSWARPGRGGLLLGGVADQSTNTSELLAGDTDTSVQHFPLKYQTVWVAVIEHFTITEKERGLSRGLLRDCDTSRRIV